MTYLFSLSHSQKHNKKSVIRDDVDIITIKRELRNKAQALADLEAKYEMALRQMEELSSNHQAATSTLEKRQQELQQSLQSNTELKSRLEAESAKSQLLPHKEVQIKNLRAEVESLKKVNRDLVASAFDQQREEEHARTHRALQEQIDAASKERDDMAQECARLRTALAEESEQLASKAQAYRDTHAQLLTSLLELHARVLAALVGVVDHPRLGPTARHSHLQRAYDELGRHVLGRGPANDLAAPDVDNDGTVLIWGEDWYIQMCSISSAAIALEAEFGDAFCNDIRFEEWNFLAASWDVGTGEHQIYLNGSELTATAVGTSLIGGDPTMYVGRGDSGDYFKGQIADLAIFDDALSISTIEEHFQSGIDPDSEADLLGYWPMDEGAGSTVYDNTSFLRDGTLVDGTWADSCPDE